MAVQKRVDDEDLLPFFELQKSQVLHEASAFNDTPLDPRKCCSVLTELLCLLSQGETLTPEEATTLFFGVTKLFQSEEPQLRRLVYLVIKELNQNQDEAFIVISSLEKDINGEIDLFRANAIRVHSKVIDASMLEQRARLFSQSIVNQNDHVASAAITAGVRLFPSNCEVIRRWNNEVRETTRSPKPMVSFHGLHLLYKIHQHDRRAVMRMVTTMIKSPPDSPYARCLLIRYVFSVLGSDPPKNLMTFIKGCIKHFKSPMVMFEAAKALCHVPSVAESDVVLAMNVLQEFLNSPRPVLRFAAVRALSGIVSRFPNILTPSCTVDLEHLITDTNRNIATLAITTLLKTAAEYSIDRLLSSISDFMTEIADELKVVLIDAIRSVCKKFPKKYEPLLGFLSMALREEGGYKYKNKIVDCMLLLMNDLDRAKELGLDNLCEFIEDCEYPQLSVRILHLIGELGPQTGHPSRYIRFVFNRVLLELPSVRAAAVSCLAQFAILDPKLQKDIRILLKRSLNDEDDEVRDRTAIFSTLLRYCHVKDTRPEQSGDEDETPEDASDEETFVDPDSAPSSPQISSPNYLDGDDSKDEEKESPDDDDDLSTAKPKPTEPVLTPPPPAEEMLPPDQIVGLIQVPPLEFNVKDLEFSLLGYLQANDAKKENADPTAFADTFDVAKIQTLADAQATAATSMGSKESKYQKAAAAGAELQTDVYAVSEMDEQKAEYEKFLKESVTKLPDLGDELNTCQLQSLTEPEAEYQAEVVKHMYAKHIVLQVNVTHSMDNQLLTDVFVEVDYDDSEVSTVPCPLLRSGDTGMSLLIIERKSEDMLSGGGGDDGNEESVIMGRFDTTLKFTVKDATVETPEYEEGYEDEYALNELKLSHRDYIVGIPDISQLQFKQKWKDLENVKPVQRQGQLHLRSIQDAIDHLMKRVGLSSVEDSHIAKEDVPTHVVNLVGKTIDGDGILMRAAFAQDAKHIGFRVAIRGTNDMFTGVLIKSF